MRDRPARCKKQGDAAEQLNRARQPTGGNGTPDCIQPGDIAVNLSKPGWRVRHMRGAEQTEKSGARSLNAVLAEAEKAANARMFASRPYIILCAPSVNDARHEALS